MGGERECKYTIASATCSTSRRRCSAVSRGIEAARADASWPAPPLLPLLLLPPAAAAAAAALASSARVGCAATAAVAGNRASASEHVCSSVTR